MAKFMMSDPEGAIFYISYCSTCFAYVLYSVVLNIAVDLIIILLPSLPSRQSA